MFTNRSFTVQGLVAMFLVPFMLILGLPMQVRAQQKREAFTKAMFFNSEDECKAAYTSGNFRYYVPDPDNLKKLPREAKGSPVAYCVQEDARKESNIKNPWMIDAAGTPMVFDEDGNPIIDGRCHNSIHDAVALPLPTGSQGLQGPKGDRGEPGLNGRRGPQGLPGPEGQVGPQGPEGPQGLKGDQGDRGRPGKDTGHKKLWAVIGIVGGAAAAGIILSQKKKGCGCVSTPVYCPTCVAGLPATPGRQ